MANLMSGMAEAACGGTDIDRAGQSFGILIPYFVENPIPFIRFLYYLYWDGRLLLLRRRRPLD